MEAEVIEKVLVIDKEKKRFWKHDGETVVRKLSFVLFCLMVFRVANGEGGYTPDSSIVHHWAMCSDIVIHNHNF